MVKPRLCFTLLYSNGKFHVSRNFDLQSVGNFDWLLENYEFDSIARALDELIILNVSRGPFDWEEFIGTVQLIGKHCFMPIAVGGGIRGEREAEHLFSRGADKVVLNTALWENPELISRLAAKFGSQSIVASVDFRRDAGGQIHLYSNCGSKLVPASLQQALTSIERIGAGEVLINSIDRDGTGEGYDLDALRLAASACSLPIVASGGADTCDQLSVGLRSGSASAAATAHLFNFMGDGLRDARDSLIQEGISLAHWDFGRLAAASSGGFSGER